MRKQTDLVIANPPAVLKTVRVSVDQGERPVSITGLVVDLISIEASAVSHRASRRRSAACAQALLGDLIKTVLRKLRKVSAIDRAAKFKPADHRATEF
jgi:hypothetical protein